MLVSHKIGVPITKKYFLMLPNISFRPISNPRSCLYLPFFKNLFGFSIPIIWQKEGFLSFLLKIIFAQESSLILVCYYWQSLHINSLCVRSSTKKMREENMRRWWGEPKKVDKRTLGTEENSKSKFSSPQFSKENWTFWDNSQVNFNYRCVLLNKTVLMFYLGIHLCSWSSPDNCLKIYIYIVFAEIILLVQINAN